MTANRRSEVTFSLSAPTVKGLYRVRVTIETGGLKMQGTLAGMYPEDQARSLLAKLGAKKGRK